jgi:hypothetical protein
MGEIIKGDSVPDIFQRVLKIAEISEKIIRYCLIAVLIFWGGMLMFVFILNWEGWFFGIRIAGLYAGIYLLAESLTALFLAFSVIRFTERRIITGGLSLIFFSFMLLDSAVTRQIIHPGSKAIPELFVIFALISLLYLISCIIKEYTAKKS